MRRCTIVAVVTTALVAACGDDADGPLIDERAGTVDGVGLGDPLRDARRAFGAPDGGRSAPTAEVGLPWVVVPPSDRRAGERADVAAYRDLNFLAFESTGIYGVSVWRDGARTEGGIALGDSLDDARERYDGLRCDVRNEGTEYTSYPYCMGRIGGTYIWFGQDPIRSISVLSTRPG